MTAAPWTRIPAERLALAFRHGDAARDQHRIRPAAHMLYEHLIRFAGERDWCWPGEERLASQMQCSVSTVKRMLRELIQAGLIARARRLNRSSLTYITAYNTEVYEASIDITNSSLAAAVAPVNDNACDSTDATNVFASTEVSTGLFLGTTDEPSVGPETNQVINLKTQHTEGLVDGGDFPPNNASLIEQSVPETATVQMLRNAGVVDPGVLVELAHHPLTQVELAVRSVDRIRRVDDPRRPGLLVHILRHARYNVMGEHRQQACDSSGRRQAILATEHQNIIPPSQAACDDELAVLWQKMLTCVAQEVPSDEFRTWLQPTSLVEMDGHTAVVTTPNVFVRDTFIAQYARPIRDTLTHQFGHPIDIVVVIS